MPKGRLTPLGSRIAPLKARGAQVLKAGDVRLRGSGLQARNRRLFRKNPLCVACAAQGRVAPVDEWDHVIPLWEGGHDVEENIQGLCHGHHEQKTAEEAKRRGG